MNPEALLGALGGGAPGPEAAPPDALPPEEGPPTDVTPVDALRTVLESIEIYQGVEQDDIDLAEAAKVYALVQKLLAKNQQETEAAMGTTSAHRGMARALQQQGGGGGF